VSSLPLVAGPARAQVLARAKALEIGTLAWNLAEAAAGLAIAIPTGSVALLGFAIDSLVESASAAVLLWRLGAERKHTDAAAIERVERRAARLVGVSLVLLAVYVGIEAGLALWRHDAPEPSWIALAIPLAAMGFMRWLARAKRAAAAVLGSRALAADAFQSSACFWLSAITLGGIALNAILGWWWADPVAALGMSAFIAREGRDVWNGESACGCHACQGVPPDAGPGSI